MIWTRRKVKTFLVCLFFHIASHHAARALTNIIWPLNIVLDSCISINSIITTGILYRIQGRFSSFTFYHFPLFVSCIKWNVFHTGFHLIILKIFLSQVTLCNYCNTWRPRDLFRALRYLHCPSAFVIPPLKLFLSSST